MSSGNESTAMIHFECGTCGVNATCVDTPSARLAWYDHMENHALKQNYRAVTWVVVPLEFD